MTTAAPARELVLRPGPDIVPDGPEPCWYLARVGDTRYYEEECASHYTLRQALLAAHDRMADLYAEAWTHPTDRREDWEEPDRLTVRRESDSPCWIAHCALCGEPYADPDTVGTLHLDEPQHLPGLLEDADWAEVGGRWFCEGCAQQLPHDDDDDRYLPGADPALPVVAPGPGQLAIDGSVVT